MFTGSFSASAKPAYLFELKIPELDIVHQSTTASLLPYDTADFVKLQIRVKKSGGGTITLPFADRRVESFILYQFDKNEITGSRRLSPAEVSPPEFPRR